MDRARHRGGGGGGGGEGGGGKGKKEKKKKWIQLQNSPSAYSSRRFNGKYALCGADRGGFKPDTALSSSLFFPFSTMLYQLYSAN